MIAVQDELAVESEGVDPVGNVSLGAEFRGGTVVGGTARKIAAFKIEPNISRYYLGADALPIEIDNALPVGHTVEFWHDTVTNDPQHVLTPKTGGAGSGSIAQLPGTAAAAFLTWPAGQGTMVLTQKTAGVWVCA